MDSNNTHRPAHPSRSSSRAAALAVISALALFATACGDDEGDDVAASGGEPTVDVTSPTDGSQVGESFDVEFAINFPIGEPDTGRDHVHLYYDGNFDEGEYGIAYDETFTVTGLSPGEHTLQAVVAHADHSITDARSEEIIVEVTDDDSGSDTSDAPATSDEGFGY